MNSKRVFLLLLAVLALVFLGLVGGAYGITSLLKDKSAELAISKAQVNQLTTEQNGLAKSKHEIAQYSALETITKSIVPQDKDQAEAVREVTNIAEANDVPLTSVTFPNSTLGAVSGTTAAGTPTAPVTSVGGKATLSQLTPVVNIPGVYDLQITIMNNASNTVTFNQLDNFLKGLENNRRTAEVSNLSIQPQPSNPSQLTFSLILNDYIKP